MNNAVFKKTMKNVRKHKDIKLVKLKKEKIIQYHKQTIIQQKIFFENSLTIEIKRTQIFMNKPIYLALSIS